MPPLSQLSLRQIPLLITSAVKPSAPFVGLSDIQARLEYLADSIRLWKASGVAQIVVCDGSVSDIYSRLSELIDLTAPSCAIEVLGFVNSLADVERFGKGYGEGEIVKYALRHSNLLSQAAYFAKCTGRLYVSNYWDVLSRFDGDFGASFLGLACLPQYLDTRFYVTSKEFFGARLAEAYRSVNDPIGIYLENVYFAVLINSKNVQWVLRTPPRYVGVSGTCGLPYAFDRLYLARLLIANIYWIAQSVKLWLQRARDAKPFQSY